MRFSISALAALTLLWALPAQADVVTFQYQDVGCNTDCSALGVPDGTPLNLTISVDSSSLIPASFLSASSLIAFDASVGSFHMTNTDALGLWFFGVVSSDAQSILNPLMVASDAIGPPLGSLFRASYQEWTVSDSGYCSSAACNSYYVGFGDTEGAITTATNSYSFSRVDAAPTDAPEPLTASLFLAGLAGIGLGRRRRHV